MIGPDIAALVAVLVVGVLALALPVALVWGLFKVLQGLVWVLTTLVGGLFRGLALGARGVGGAGQRLAGFARSTVGDALRVVGGLVTAAILVPLVVLDVCMGRWSGANHYGRALEDELRGTALAFYRVALGNPARFLGLGALTEGIERRLPEVMARAPRGDRPRALREFAGYRVVDSLPRGGSGAHLFLAHPLRAKLEAFARAGRYPHERVVIKSFVLDDGSTLPQIVRESRALEAAQKLGLVLDHELTADRFHYVMPYVPGDDLDLVTRTLHAESGAQGLSTAHLRQALTWTAHLLETLDRFHANGLWHKDIKPSNIIVSGERAHLVDLGLVTPLQSAMTLTTHGTEYFRDPEMVRLAMKGVKVHEVDGVKFDLYSTGAVLYSLLENSFPAHGSLSHLTRRCPEALQWVVRRAMAEMRSRYGSAREMLADVRALLAAADPFALRPAELPSLGGLELPPPLPHARHGVVFASLAEPEPAPAAASPETDSVPADVARRQASERKRKSRVRRGVVAALVLFALLTSVPIALVLGHAGHSGGYTVYDFDAPPPRPAIVAPALVAPALVAPALVANGPRVPVRDAEIAGVASRLEGLLGSEADAFARQLASWNRTLAQPVAGHRQRVLVLPDLSARVEPGTLGLLRDELERDRFDVLGVDADEAELDLVARARRAIGTSDAADGGAAARLAQFLRQTGGIDLVVWLTGGDDPARPDVRLFSADGPVAASDRAEASDPLAR